MQKILQSKAVILLLLFILGGSYMLAQNNSLEWRYSQAKENYSVKPTLENKALFDELKAETFAKKGGNTITAGPTFDGDLNGQPTWNRNYGNGYTPDCVHPSTPSASGAGTHYQAIEFHVTSGDPFVAEMSTSTLGDGHFTLYCDPFDPVNSQDNITAIDDDDGPGWDPAFYDTDGITLTPGNSYFLVVSTFGTGDDSITIHEISTGETTQSKWVACNADNKNYLGLEDEGYLIGEYKSFEDASDDDPKNYSFICYDYLSSNLFAECSKDREKAINEDFFRPLGDTIYTFQHFVGEGEDESPLKKNPLDNSFELKFLPDERKASIELTDTLRTFDALDPIKYDFALYRLGQEKLA